jgi:Type II secretion system (T2SS), protein G
VSRPTDFTDRYGCQWSPSDGWAGPYLEKIPKDPYKRAYWYDSDYVICENGIDIVVPAIVSLGPNGLFDYPRCASGSTTDDSYFRIDKM